MGGGRRVFLSHTSEFGEDPPGSLYVLAAKDACNLEGFTYEDMSLFTAGDRTSDLCRQKMSGCDIYVGIIGFSYGSEVRDEPHHSYTELEFEQAVEDGIHLRVFMVPDGADGSAGTATDDPVLDPRQRDFRRRLQADPRFTVGWFGSPERLRDRVSQALRELGDAPSRRRGRRRPFMAEAPPLDLVPRADELEAVCDKIRAAADRDRDGTTDGAPAVVLRGAGGFGKTTLAVAACHELGDAFPDGVLWVTLGVEPTEQQRIGWCRDLALQFVEECPTFDDPRAAGSHLGQVLADRRVLLVLDDVWRSKDLDPFLLLGPSTIRLVTTRVDDVVPPGVEPVRVDQFSTAEAVALLGWGLDADGVDWDELVSRTGRWPVLVRLVNRAVRDDVSNGSSVSAATAAVAADLAARGPAILDVADEEDRKRAVRATVEVGIERLSRRAGPDGVRRFIDLAVFPEDTDVPLDVLADWWGLEMRDVRRAASDVSHLSLVQSYDAGTGTVRLHDVLRDYLRRRMGSSGLRARHAALLAAHRPASGRWADLPEHADYMWRWVVVHLAKADLVDELLATTRDVVFLARKLHRLGDHAVLDDVALAAEHGDDRLRQWLRRWSHLVHGLPQPVDVAATLLARPEAALVLTPVDEQPLDGTHLRYALGWSCPEPASASLETVLGTHDKRVHDVTWSPDGRRVASAGGDGSVRVWALDSVEEPKELARPDEWVRAVSWSPDGRRLAYGDGEGAVWLWSPDDPVEHEELGRHGIWVRAVSWSPDGRRIASASDDGGVRVWTAAGDGDPVALGGDDEWIRSVAWSPDGRRVVSASDHGVVRVWPATGAAPPVEVGRHEGGTSAVAWAPDGTRVASGGDDGALRTWSVDRAGARTEPGSHAAPVRGVAWSPDGALLASGGDDGAVRLWPADGGVGDRELGRHDGGVLAIAWSPDGHRVASGGGDGALRVWRTDGVAPADGEGRAQRVRSVAWSPDGNWLACGGDDHTVWMWSAGGRGGATEIGRHHSSVVTVAWSPDGRRVASGDGDGVVRIWSRDDPDRRIEVGGHGPRLPAVAWSPDGRQLACAGADGVVRLIHADGGDWSMEPIGGEWVRTVAWSPDGRRLVASGIDGALRLWDVARPRTRAVEVGLLGHHGDQVRTVAWSPDGHVVASGGEDGVVRRWSVDGEGGSSELVGQDAAVRSLAWSSTGRHMASAGGDGAVRLWALGDDAGGSPDPLCTLALDGSLSGVAWQPRGPLLAVAGSSGLYVLEVAGMTP